MSGDLRADTEELAAIAAHRPFPARTPMRRQCALHRLPEGGAAGRRAIADAGPSDAHRLVSLHRRELYWFLRTKLSESSLFSGSVLEKTMGAP